MDESKIKKSKKRRKKKKKISASMAKRMSMFEVKPKKGKTRD